MTCGFGLADHRDDDHPFQHVSRPVFETTCLVCKKPMQVGNEEFVGCVVCDDCPFPKEICGKEDCDGECCNCVYCVVRRNPLP